MKMNHHAHDPYEPPSEHGGAGKTVGFSVKSDAENCCTCFVQRHAGLGCNIHLDEASIECP